MTAAQLRRAEEPFFTGKPHGTGLGLAVCRSIVSEVRGAMRIRSARGQGTTVELSLPTEPPPAEREADA